MDLDEKEIDLRKCMEEVLVIFSAKAAQAGLKLTCQVDGAIPLSIITDKDRLRQILINLIANALNSPIRERYRCGLSFPGQPAGQENAIGKRPPLRSGQIELGFEVKDTGIGIAPDKLDHLFKAFSQVDSSSPANMEVPAWVWSSATTDQPDGRRIKVESEEGKGSTFTLLS